MIGHRFKANCQKEAFLLTSSNEKVGITEQERHNNQKKTKARQRIELAYMLAKAHINTKDLIRRAITVVVIWIDRIPRYNRNVLQTERNNQNGKR